MISRYVAVSSALATFILLSGPAFGQSTRVITVADAIELASSQPSAVQNARYEVEAMDAVLAQQRVGQWPVLNLTTQGQQRYGLAFDQTAGQLTQATTESGFAEVNASWTVFDGFASRSAIASARASRAAAEWNRSRVEQSSVYEAVWLFHEVATAAAEIEIAQANVEAQRQQLELVDAQITAGQRPPSEVFLQEERVAEAELALLQRDRQHRLQVLRLVRHLALDPHHSYTFAAPDTSRVIQQLAPVDALVVDALERRPDLQAQQASIESAQAELRATRATLLPSVSLIGGYGTTYTSTSQADFGAQVGNNRGGSVGLRITLPILSFGQSGARARFASARLRQLQVAADDQRQQVSVEVQEAALDLSIRQQEVAVAERRRTAAAAAIEAERERYRLGLTTLPSVAEVSSRFVEAEVGLVRARYALAVATILLNHQVGRSIR